MNRLSFVVILSCITILSNVCNGQNGDSGCSQLKNSFDCGRNRVCKWFPINGPNGFCGKNPTQRKRHGKWWGHPTKSPTESPVVWWTKNPTKVKTPSPTTESPMRRGTRDETTPQPSETPTESPTTSKPTKSPTESPTTKTPTTSKPTESPTESPTKSPTTKPPTTNKPTKSPTESPTTKTPTTSKPTESPTESPTTKPPTTNKPTESPTESPTTTTTTRRPTEYPTESPTTTKPTESPTESPTKKPKKPHPTWWNCPPSKCSPPDVTFRKRFSWPAPPVPVKKITNDDSNDSSEKIKYHNGGYRRGGHRRGGGNNRNNRNNRSGRRWLGSNELTCSKCDSNDDEYNVEFLSREVVSFSWHKKATRFCYRVSVDKRSYHKKYCDDKHKSSPLMSWALRLNKCCIVDVEKYLIGAKKDGKNIMNQINVEKDEKSSYFIRWNGKINAGKSGKFCYLFRGIVSADDGGKYCVKSSLNTCGCSCITTPNPRHLGKCLSNGKQHYNSA